MNTAIKTLSAACASAEDAYLETMCGGAGCCGDFQGAITAFRQSLLEGLLSSEKKDLESTIREMLESEVPFTGRA